jgi:hypothetical protein
MRVLLVVIDAASPRVVCPAVQAGRLPNLKRLADAGDMHAESTTIFPSITPAATTSIITGVYPSEHGIAGASWYDTAREEVAYYGDDFWVVAREGAGNFLHDFLVRLNGDRLHAPTLFEMVERTGRRAACLNYLVYRGLVTHQIKVPWLMALIPGVRRSETVEGPDALYLGDFVVTRSPHRRKLDHRGGLLHRYGMDDASTAALLADLASDGPMPDFTVAYFADNDYISHEVGPHAALPVVERVDAALGAMFDAAGGFERFMRDTCVIVTSDHGHCDILPDREEAAISLQDVLGDFRHATLGRPWQDGDEIMICPNMRAAQIYVREPAALTERVARQMLLEPRIDLIMWRTAAHADRSGYSVLGPDGRLEFWAEGAGADPASPAPRQASGRGVDDFGTTWLWQGDAEVLDLEFDGNRIRSSTYPNAFERIAGVLEARNSGELWVTAQPGCEFEVPGGHAHVGGGSHGALHALDSLSPVIMAGTPRRLPRALRSVDLAPLCMDALGASMRYGIGDARGTGPRTPLDATRRA